MTATKSLLAAISLALFGLLALGVSTEAQRSPSAQTPPLVIKSTYGADLYQFYCSSCHGVTARGGALRGDPHQLAPDLTVLARKSDGVFPRDRVRATITFGPGAAAGGAHGTSNMPVWGAVFRGLDSDSRMTELRIENLVQYLASLQEAAVGHED
jgi:mono/diheme cytochrome c family protein